MFYTVGLQKPFWSVVSRAFSSALLLLQVFPSREWKRQVAAVSTCIKVWASFIRFVRFCVTNSELYRTRIFMLNSVDCDFALSGWTQSRPSRWRTPKFCLWTNWMQARSSEATSSLWESRGSSSGNREIHPTLKFSFQLSLASDWTNCYIHV